MTGKLEIGGRNKTIKTTALLIKPRILNRLLKRLDVKEKTTSYNWYENLLQVS